MSARNLEEREQAITDCKFELVRDSSHQSTNPDTEARRNASYARQ